MSNMSNISDVIDISSILNARGIDIDPFDASDDVIAELTDDSIDYIEGLENTIRSITDDLYDLLDQVVAVQDRIESMVSALDN